MIPSCTDQCIDVSADEYAIMISVQRNKVYFYVSNVIMKIKMTLDQKLYFIVSFMFYNQGILPTIQTTS